MSDMSNIIVGPILGLENNNTYTVVYTTPTNVEISTVRIGAITVWSTHIGTTPTSMVWRAEYTATTSKFDQKVTYSIYNDSQRASNTHDANRWNFFIPGTGSEPRLCYASCNGFSSKELTHRTPSPYRMWDELIYDNFDSDISLLIMGGDQVYADDIWSAVDLLQEWNDLPYDEKVTHTVTRKLYEEIDRFYDKLYRDNWTKKSISRALASIPSIMMWDDHDIIDGWGSHPVELQNCDVFSKIYQVARKYFELYQIRSNDNNSLLSDYSYVFGLKFRNYSILGLDNRSTRTLSTVMDNAQWKEVNTFLDNVTDTKLLVMSGIPIVARDYDVVEQYIDSTDDTENLSDDIKDQWRAKGHKDEREKLIRKLLDIAEPQRNNTVVILSGDAHVGWAGKIKQISTQTELHQIVSSAIVHPPPSKLEWLGIMAATDDNDELLDDDIVLSFNKDINGDGFIRHRNYSILENNDDTIYVSWNVEAREIITISLK